jgi:hypothetical protein
MRVLGCAARRWLRRGVLSVSALLGLSVAAVVLAHHSFAMYDNDHQVKLQGTVNSFEWNNPHVYIELAATDAQGTAKTITVECASPGILTRVGWKCNMIKAGDTITVVVAPLRTGEPGALLKQITLADGRKFSNGPFAGKPKVE